MYHFNNTEEASGVIKVTRILCLCQTLVANALQWQMKVVQRIKSVVETPPEESLASSQLCWVTSSPGCLRVPPCALRCIFPTSIFVPRPSPSISDTWNIFCSCSFCKHQQPPIVHSFMILCCSTKTTFTSLIKHWQCQKVRPVNPSLERWTLTPTCEFLVVIVAACVCVQCVYVGQTQLVYSTLVRLYSSPFHCCCCCEMKACSADWRMQLRSVDWSVLQFSFHFPSPARLCCEIQFEERQKLATL